MLLNEPEENDSEEDKSIFKSKVFDSEPVVAEEEAAQEIKAIQSAAPMDVVYENSFKNPLTYTVPGETLANSTQMFTKEKTTSIFDTAEAKWEQLNTGFEVTHAAYIQYQKVDPLQDIAPAGWSPTSEDNQWAYEELDSQFYKFLIDSKGPKDFQARYLRALREQDKALDIENGYFLAAVLGGAVGIVTDPASYIPVLGWVKYAKFGPTIVKSMKRAFPGLASYGIMESAGTQLEKINGNVEDFLVDSMINTAWGLALFGGLGAAGLGLAKMELWKLRGLEKDRIDGLEYHLKVDKEGKLEGYLPIDTTGELSAQRMRYAKEMADSSFQKMGVFKVPYLGDFLLNKFFSNFLIGSVMPKYLNSKYTQVAAFFDKSFEHNMITKGVYGKEYKVQIEPLVKAGEKQPLKKGVIYISRKETAGTREVKGPDGAVTEEAYTERTGSLINEDGVIEEFNFPADMDFSDISNKINSKDFIKEVKDHASMLKVTEDSKAKPVRFESLMNKSYAAVRSIADNLQKMHAQRNGLNMENYLIRSGGKMGMAAKNKAMKAFNKEGDLDNYVSKEEFFDEIETALYTGTPNANSVVNDAVDAIIPFQDNLFAAYRKSQNLPENWMPPRTAVNYLMRVYDTAYMNGAETEWVEVISNYLRESDEKIAERMTPINALEDEVQRLTESRTSDMSDFELGKSSRAIESAGRKLKKEKAKLQDELRSNEDYQLWVEDYAALSSSESKELTKLLEPKIKLEKEHKALKAKISSKKKEIGLLKLKTKSVRTKDKLAEIKVEIKDMEKDLKVMEPIAREVEEKLYDEIARISDLATDGKVHYNLFYRDAENFEIKFKDPKNKLKFREVYESHAKRELAATNNYNTILNQTAEDTINDVMGNFVGNSTTNSLKQRTLMYPDNLLRENNFLSKDLIAKLANYSTFISRRTHFKDVFSSISADGSFESILADYTMSYKEVRAPLNKTVAKASSKLKLISKIRNKSALTAEEEKLKNTIGDVDLTKLEAELKKEVRKAKRALDKEKAEFDDGKESMNKAYAKMMGRTNTERKMKAFEKITKNLVSSALLGFLPFAQASDIGVIGLEHGTWQFVQSTIYPSVQSLFGTFKTHNSKTIREINGALLLGLQHTLQGINQRNDFAFANPYINQGKVVNATEKLAHFTANASGSNQVDNVLQSWAGATVQSSLMRDLIKYTEGTATVKDIMYLNKYGIDPKEWAETMVYQFKKNGGGTNGLGGHQSLFWEWKSDEFSKLGSEASVVFGDAVFRGVKAAIFQKGMMDSPFWTDKALGSIVNTFHGWGHASINRVIVPSLQQLDGQRAMGVGISLVLGYYNSPLRRFSRGQDPFPEDQTDQERMWETLLDSGVSSWAANAASDIDLISGGRLLKGFTSDKRKFYDRSDLFGAPWGAANKLLDVGLVGWSGEMNQKDAEKLARMVPVANSIWGTQISNQFVNSLDLPKTRARARNINRNK